MSSNLILAQTTDVDLEREGKRSQDKRTSCSREITVRVEGDSGPLLVIPIQVNLDGDGLTAGYLDVKIEVCELIKKPIENEAESFDFSFRLLTINCLIVID